jgi:transcriptional regulator with XRE-family HTH domain
MTHIANNIRFLRSQRGETQQAFAEWLGITRSAIGAYEEGRAKPNFEVLEKLATHFGLSFDQLLREDLTQQSSRLLSGRNAPAHLDATGKGLRVLAITVDADNREYIDLVPQKAAAGYLNGYADPTFVEELPRFRLPMLQGGTFRAFEISGDSMLPIQPGSILIGEYLDDWTRIRDGLTYIIVSQREGIVYKRVFNKVAERGELILQSDNPAYPPFSVPVDDVLEVWQAKAYISTIFPDKGISIDNLMQMVMELQQEVIRLKERKD